ncbi:MAG: type II toxin-antitoxin system PemK/MazF family toxin [Candidatus Rokubacteria bacterium]|nr:type II toxin-antitoxin system PemK/MazF family toxin [Candidatus Rokubacteria bacterium]
MKRGEVWWADLPAPAGRRPVVLLSRDAAYAVRTSITVAPITRTVRDIPVEVSLGREDGLRATCVVSLDDITTIPKALLTRRVSLLSQARIETIEVAIRFALDLA